MNNLFAIFVFTLFVREKKTTQNTFVLQYI